MPPYVSFAATHLEGRLGKTLQVCSTTVVVAMGINADGRRELLDLKVGDSETTAVRAAFIASLKGRHLCGVQLVISDAHMDLTKAIPLQLQDCMWQRRTERCAGRPPRVPVHPNLLQRLPGAQQGMVAAALGSVWVRCCWSRTSTGSWRAAAMFFSESMAAIPDPRNLSTLHTVSA